MSNYSKYTVQIYIGDDRGYAAQRGEDMKAKFPDADYELIEGDPMGVCSFVDPDDARGKEIADWINTSR